MHIDTVVMLIMRETFHKIYGVIDQTTNETVIVFCLLSSYFSVGANSIGICDVCIMRFYVICIGECSNCIR